MPNGACIIANESIDVLIGGQSSQHASQLDNIAIPYLRCSKSLGVLDTFPQGNDTEIVGEESGINQRLSEWVC